MKMNTLGRTGIEVSEICLGTMTWGSQNTEAEAHLQMDYAISEGVNFLDTAQMYPTTPFSPDTVGGTETIIGTWFGNRKKRDDVILATKVAGKGSANTQYAADITAKKIRWACEASLKRLQTDYIDLYQLHWPNRGSYHFRQTWDFTPSEQDNAKALADMEEIIGEIGRLVEEGKIRAFGLSNDTAWGTMQYLRLAEEKGLPRVASIQNEYSLMHRIFDTDMAELSHHESVGLLAYTPLAAGLLTGKYAGGDIPQGSRRSLNETLAGRVNPVGEKALARYLDVAKKHGVDPTRMAIAFALSRPFMTSVIIGATSMEQLKTCVSAAELKLDDAVMDDIAQVYREYPLPM